MVTCSGCGEFVQEGRFCTSCGARLTDSSGAASHRDGARRTRAAAAETSGRLVACPRCGAVNAASRVRCARCGTDLTAEPDDEQQRGSAGGDAVVADDELPLPGVLVLVTVVTSVAVLAVALTMLSARGVGPFAGPDDNTGGPSESRDVEVIGITASSELAPAGSTTYDATNLIDGDPSSAWNEGEPGDGSGERLELHLAEPTTVTGLLVWNGYQSEDFFVQHNRVRTLRLELADRTFTVQLLDRRGPQAVDLPGPVTAERIGIEVTETYPGDRYNDAALSEIEVLGISAGPQPSTNV